MWCRLCGTTLLSGVHSFPFPLLFDNFRTFSLISFIFPLQVEVGTEIAIIQKCSYLRGLRTRKCRE